MSGDVSIEDLLGRPYVADPLRAHDCAPVGDGAAVVILASGARARELCERPAWITSFAHRIESGSLGARDLLSAGAGLGPAAGPPVQVAELHAPFTHQEILLRRALGLDGETEVNPSGGALCGNPMFAAGLARIGCAARAIMSGRAASRPRARDQRARAAAEPGLRHGGTMKVKAAVLGVGQTRHRSKRTDVSMAGLCREAVDRALADAGLTFADIDAVVVGKAPDLFEGVMMPELYLADALGAVGKPLLRVHTAGSVGGATGIVTANLVQAGIHRRVLAVAWEKQSESNAMWALSIAPPFSIQVVAGAGGYFAPHIRAYIRRSGAPPHDRGDGRGQGPAQRRAEPVRPPAAAGHHAGVGAGLPHALGSGPVRRDLPVVGRRVRGGHRRRGGGAGQPGGRWPGSGRPRCGPSRRCSRARTR